MNLSYPLELIKVLGVRQLAYFLAYRLAQRSGYNRRKTPIRPLSQGVPYRTRLFELPEKTYLEGILGVSGVEQVLDEAQKICDGQYMYFGGEWRALPVDADFGTSHWCDYEHLELWEGEDIKFAWEVGRFGWAFPLARAYYLSSDSLFARIYWRYLEAFFQQNPPNQGVQWVSGQEVALRLIAMLFATNIFLDAQETTESHLSLTGFLIQEHANRILPTLNYALAQNNNHLISEAVGLITASLALPGHAKSGLWWKTGWKWFNWAYQHQIDERGEYVQHSTNYHRLVLHAALWINLLLVKKGIKLPGPTKDKIRLAVKWLYALLDHQSGRVPNLGHNDGANILSLSTCPFTDFRPVIQASAGAFYGVYPLGDGIWNDMAAWLGMHPSAANETASGNLLLSDQEHIGVLGEKNRESWGYLRVYPYQRRPGHADQLHLDLWFAGENITLDPGTFLYNAPAPWRNNLMSTLVHNTVSLENRDQMVRAGKFLYIYPAKGEIKEVEKDGAHCRIVAEHDGYRQLNVLHRRSVLFKPEGTWYIEDQILPAGDKYVDSKYWVRLHWLFPDWAWELSYSEDRCKIKLDLISKARPIHVSLLVKASEVPKHIQLVRAGTLIEGSGDTVSIDGWISPTYGLKRPALGLNVLCYTRLPVNFTSVFDFRANDEEG